MKRKRLGNIRDARAQLWARVYATMFDKAAEGRVCEITQDGVVDTAAARKVARDTADAAVSDFDERFAELL